MPIETGPYCAHCANEEGELKPFDERFESMVSWKQRENGKLTRAAAEAQTLSFMGTLPAWRKHPDFIARIAKNEETTERVCVARHMEEDASMSWDDFRFFLQVARDRTLSAAARRLDVTQPTVGRRIEALQARVGPLFDRDGQQLSLTDLGREILPFAEALDDNVLAIERCFRSHEARSQATVRVATTLGLSTHWLTGKMHRFHAEAPDIRLAVETGIRYLNVMHREADIALRMGSPGDDRLVGSRVAYVGCGLYASTKYLEAHGRPTSPNELRDHHVIESEGDIGDLKQVRALRAMASSCEVSFRADNVSIQVAAVREGLGVATIPCFMVDHLEGVERILCDHFDIKIELWLLVNPSLKDQPAIRRVVGFLRAEIATDAQRFEGRSA